MKKTLLLFMLLLFVTTVQAQRTKCVHRFTPYPEKEVRAKTRAQDGVPNHFEGEKKGLIILMEFKDTKFLNKNKNGKTFDVNGFWNDIANKEGLKNVNGNLVAGSIRDYFLDQSYGEFTLDFDVRGPYTAANKYAYYGRNKQYNGGLEFDQNPVELIIEAVKAAEKEVNYKDYDWDGDGEVDQVYVIYAGHGEASYDDADLIWPHESSIDGWGVDPVVLQGLKINTYACGNEMARDEGQIMGIGTICHEFSHCLGLLDLYNTETGESSVGDYDIMDRGNYNGSSWYPAGYSSFERYFCGWLDPVRVGSYAEVGELRPLTQYPDGAIITREMGSTEYYLIEKRKKEKWDKFLPTFSENVSLTEVELAWHINYDLTRWLKNEVNTDPDNLGVTLVPLDEVPSYPTVIVAPKNTREGCDCWYDLQGRRLSGKPTQKGVYVHGSQKRVIK